MKKKKKGVQKGKTWSGFREVYDYIKKSTMIEELPLMDVDIVYVDEKSATVFHNGYENAVILPPETAPQFSGDGVRIGLDFYSIDQKAILDIATVGGLKGEGLSEQCKERAALISRRIAFKEDKYKFLLQDGEVIGIKKNVPTCPSIVETVEMLPSRNVRLGKRKQPKIVRDWIITDDFYKVYIEYACLGATDTLMPYCVVQDSDTGESSLCITFGAMFNKDGKTGFLPMCCKKYQHNKVISVFQIYEDVQYSEIEQFIAIKNMIEKTKDDEPEEIELSKEFTKNLNKQRLKELDMSGDTLYDQIVSLTVSTAQAIEGMEIKQQNSTMDALFKEIYKIIV